MDYYDDFLGYYLWIKSPQDSKVMCLNAKYDNLIWNKTEKAANLHYFWHFKRLFVNDIGIKYC